MAGTCLTLDPLSVLNYYLKKEYPTPLEQAEDELARKKILEAVRAVNSNR